MLFPLLKMQFRPKLGCRGLNVDPVWQHEVFYRKNVFVPRYHVKNYPLK